MIRNTLLKEMVENPFFSREVLTAERVKTMDRDNNLLEKLIIKDQPIQPGMTVILCLSSGGSYNLGFQSVLTKKTLSRIHGPVEHWDRVVPQLH
jgi:hypothetical protein